MKHTTSIGARPALGRSATGLSGSAETLAVFLVLALVGYGCDDVAGEAPEVDAAADARPGPDPDAAFVPPDADLEDLDAGPRCTEPGQCPDGQLCVDGQCLPPCRPGGCPGGYCGPDGLCVAGACPSDEACPVGAFCAANGACLRGCRKAPDDCPMGQVCDDNHVCVPDFGCLEEEICGNGRDDDCNGVIDDPVICQAPCLEDQPCETGGVGRCGEGLTACPGGNVGPSMCVSTHESAPERCNGLDDDCDGEVDEDFDLGEPCPGGEGVCDGRGVWACDPEGARTCDFTGTAELERCDGLDNDCDGTIDEDWPEKDAACVAGEGQCAAQGRWRCAAEGDPGREPGAGLVCDASPGVPGVEICDGQDNDCDGRLDEAWPDVGQLCTIGVGTCAATGRIICARDGEITRCDAAPRIPAPEICNGFDDDCDGAIDEGADGNPLAEPCYDADPDSRDRGECRGGRRTCVDGGWGACEGQVVPAPEICNGLDDDCNGVADDDDGAPLSGECYTGPDGTLGEGVCQGGRRGCAFGVDGPCVGELTPVLEICNGLDDDCNGIVDDVEGGCACEVGESQPCYRGPAGTEGVGRCVAGVQRCLDDGSGWGPCEGEALPRAETCNGEDDNCNGVADDGVAGVGLPCRDGVGVCLAEGTLGCDPAVGVTCSAEAGEPAEELCDALDNDCDGRLDEAFAVGQPCVRGVGACLRQGHTRCGGRFELTCDSVPGFPEDERCDGIDNDCDGQIDEDFQIGRLCSAGVGACERRGLFACDGPGASACAAEAVEPAIETCDGIDNDCDGNVDEGFALGVACSVGLGLCSSAGRTVCGEDGGVTCDAPPRVGRPELCNGIDDDCDGRIDEGLGAGPPCQTDDSGICGPGRLRCVAGAQACVAANIATEEICNGLDDDCDGEIDEGLGTVSCGQGECARELPACSAGRLIVCDPGAGAADVELCNGLDDDCDGAIDEDAIGDGNLCEAGVGTCQRLGRQSCVDGGLVCDAVPGEPTVELCNGRDDDCDGRTDEAPVDAERPCYLGVGECRSEGRTQCVAGDRDGAFAPEIICDAEPGEPGAEVCDGVDNDCDALIDEGFGSTVCGLGACRHAAPNCDGGQPPACDPMEGASDEICNGVDDDCDGVVDEDAAGLGDPCDVGVGECRRRGATVCQVGRVVCQGAAGLPAFEVCNGLDDDCDGIVDEDALDVGRACTAGAGACERGGVTRCQAGRAVCGATAGVPRAELCNGVDDDCDGVVDEGFGDVEVCGLGVCRRVFAACGDVPDCDPLDGASSERCDGLDNDCDGQVDEGAVDVGTPCSVGEGACFREGVTVCTGGGETCGVQPGAPSAEICNGLDDDCDGRIDEGNICPDVTPPVVTVTVIPNVVDLGEAVTITVRATDDRGVERVTLRINGTPTLLDGNQQARYTPRFAGVHTITGQATDFAGNTGSDEVRLRVLDGADVTPPVIRLVSPAEDAILTEATEVRGEIEDANLFAWRVEVAPVGTAEWVVMAEGSQAPADGLLGVIDPTMLENGIYTLRVYAEDVNGRTATLTRPVRLDGEVKIGAFSITYTDLTVPVSGVPLTIERTYDSRIKARRDFGVGWSLTMRQGKLQHNRPVHEGWRINPGGFLGLPCQSTQELEPHVSEVHLSDSERYVFRLRVQPNGALLGACQVRVDYVFITGSVPGPARLELLDGGFAYYLNGTDSLMTDDLSDDYKVDRVRLVTPDGRRILLRRQDGVYQVADANNNRVDFGRNGVVHSAGKSVSFQRDAANRITRVVAPSGDEISYGYDARGDLTTVTDELRNTTRYRYDARHNLIEIVDPTGRTPARQEYDDDGRLVAIVYPDGTRLAMEHDPDARVEIVRDRTGAFEVFTYDARGNVLSHTDKAGHTRVSTYDDEDRKTSETDPEGNVTRYVYDAQGRMLRMEEPLGRVRANEYNAMGRPLRETDPNGNTTVRTYDANGNMTQMTDALGGVTRFTYDAAGRRTSQTDALGGVTAWTYDANGFMATETDALGHERRFTYDENGNRLTESFTWTHPDDGPTERATRFAYDARNRLIATTDPLGNTSRIEYDARGNRVAEIDALGRRTTLAYDDLGNLAARQHPDGTSTRYTYDAEGRRVSETDRAGRTTRMRLDGLGRVAATIRPDGTELLRTYDSRGNLLTETNAYGGVKTYAYDALNRPVRETDALGSVTEFTYDAQGNRTSLTGPDGQTTRYEYDALNRRTATIYPDGTRFSMAYDALGRKVSETDQAGVTTAFEYDALGRLVAVTDALGGVARYAYDELGNRVSETDALGRVTRYAHDALGRPIRQTRPGGQSRSFEYDAAGNQTRRVDYNGEVISYRYDLSDRLVEIHLPDGSVESASYTPTGERLTVSDARGVTRWLYDPNDRPTRRTEPDGTIVSFSWDAAGNRTEIRSPAGTIRHGYDLLGRLVRVTDTDGGVTTYTYNAAGSRESVTLPNGITTNYQYDDLRRLIGVQTSGGGQLIAGYAYGLGPAGNRLRVVETHRPRTVDYTYDALYRLTREVITAGGQTRTISYTYDAVGNRLTRQDSADGLIAYQHDDNDQLTSAGGVPYEHDANGNVVAIGAGAARVEYVFDPRDRLIAALQGDSAVEFVYDQDGRRVQLTVTDGGDVERIDYILDEGRRETRPLYERDGGGAITVRYLPGLEMLGSTRGGQTRYHLSDGQLSVRRLADADGQITDTYEYDAFGVELSSTGDTPNDHRYTGQFLDPHVGLYHLRARWYAPADGRFQSTDPEPALLFEPQTLHRYAYTLNDPVNHHDPSGEFLISITISFSINTSLRSIYTTNLIKTFLEVQKIALCQLAPAFELRNVGFEMLSSNIPGAEEVLMASQTMIVDGFRAIGGALASTYRNMANDMFKFKIGVKFHLDRLLGALNDQLAAGYREVADKIAKLQKFKSDLEGLLGNIGEWYQDISALANSDQGLAAQCEKAKAFQRIGNKLVDLVPSF